MEGGAVAQEKWKPASVSHVFSPGDVLVCNLQINKEVSKTIQTLQGILPTTIFSVVSSLAAVDGSINKIGSEAGIDADQIKATVEDQAVYGGLATYSPVLCMATPDVSPLLFNGAYSQVSVHRIEALIGPTAKIY